MHHCDFIESVLVARDFGVQLNRKYISGAVETSVRLTALRRGRYFTIVAHYRFSAVFR